MSFNIDMVQLNCQRSPRVTEFLEKFFPSNKLYDRDYEAWKKYDELWGDPDKFKKEILPNLPEELEYKGFPANINCFSYCGQEIGCGQEVRTPKWLINKMEREIDKKEVLPGDLIFYFEHREEGLIKYRIHCGLVEKNGKVRSKWSSFAVFVHNVFDVPHKKKSGEECETEFYRPRRYISG